MPSPSDFPAVGNIIAVEDNAVVFAPRDATYQLRLLTAGRHDGPVALPIRCLIRVAARKVYSVSSGGGFIAPIFGPPRTIQGRIAHLDQSVMVVQAGVPIVVDLPADESAYSLARWPLAVGAMVNVVAMPGARFELVSQPLTGR